MKLFKQYKDESIEDEFEICFDDIPAEKLLLAETYSDVDALFYKGSAFQTCMAYYRVTA